MPPPTQSPSRVCACWAKAEVASTAVRIAQNPVVRSVPMSPLEMLGEFVPRGLGAARHRVAAHRGQGKLQTSPSRSCKLLKDKASRRGAEPVEREGRKQVP